MLNLTSQLARRKEWLAQLRLRRGFERAFAKKLSIEFNRTGRAAAHAYLKGDSTPNLSDHTINLYKIFLALYVSVMTASSKRLPSMAPKKSLAHAGAHLQGAQEDFIRKDTEAQISLRIQIFAKKWAANKVQKVSDTTKKRINRAITRGSAENKSPGQIADDIYNTTGNDIGEFRAEVIARTETHSASQAGSLETASALGIPLKKIWVAVSDDRTRQDHADANGQTVEMDEAFEVGDDELDFPGDPSGSPEEIINCLVGDTVLDAATPQALTRRYYDGPVYVLRTTLGNELTVTPNHPVLTIGGWKPARLLKEGDKLFSYRAPIKGNIAVSHDIETRKPTVAEIFNTLAQAPDVVWQCASGMNFHGDIAASNVEIVTANGLLRYCREAGIQDELSNLGLSEADIIANALVPHGTLNHFFFCALNATHSFICRLSKFSSHSWRSILHALKHGLTAIAWLDAKILQAQTNKAPLLAQLSRDPFNRFARMEKLCNPLNKGFPLFGASQFHGIAFKPNNAGGSDSDMHSVKARPHSLGNSLKRLPACIKRDHLLSISIREFSGHVYNLQDAKGYYSASGLIQHNCRCVMVYESKDGA